MSKVFLCNDKDTVVSLSKGKLLGYYYDDVYAFKGIEYARAERFLMPEETQPWSGIKDALNDGYVCPLMWKDTFEGDIMSPHRFWLQGENCQNLNLWTPSLDPDAKLPVLVWLHGGGFFSGSAVEQLAYDGQSLSKKGQAVIIAVNHRLNVLGYLDLRGFGEKFDRSVNAGNIDLIAALRWIQENIRNFGGDPDNVTIFGQSGGGGKVITLMQMPGAYGLFHKAIVMSGTLGEVMTDPQMDMRPTIRRMLEILSVKESEIDKLSHIKYNSIAFAYLKAYDETVHKPGLPYFGPVMNEDYIGDPMKVGFSAFAKKVPVLIGSVIAEFPRAKIDRKATDDCLAQKLICEKLGENEGKALTRAFRKAYPDRPLSDVFYVDSGAFRYWIKQWIKKRTEQKACATYSYLFAPEFSVFGGTLAWHCSDIPFFFNNIDKVPVCHIHGVSDRLQAQMSDAFISFARTGVPESPLLPKWPACTYNDETTMIFDENCRVGHNFDDELIQLHFTQKVFERF